MKVKINLADYTQNGRTDLTDRQIEQIACAVLKGYDPDALNTPKRICADDFCENYLGYDLKYDYLTHNGSILGMTAFSDGVIKGYDKANKTIKDISVSPFTILIEQTLVEQGKDGRCEFSIGHECGHAILHAPEYGKQSSRAQIQVLYDVAGEYDEYGDTVERKLVTQIGSKKDKERQADYFAACLKMPRASVAAFTRRYLAENGIPGGGVVRAFDGQRFAEAVELIRAVSEFYLVSDQAARYRLFELRLIRDITEAAFTDRLRQA